MRTQSLAIAAVLFSTACSGSDGPSDVEADAIRQDNASDEVFLRLLDAEGQGNVMVNDALAPQWIAPTDGAMLAFATAPTFQWSQSATRHGVTTGDFVWLRLTGPGITAPIDVLSITTTSYTPGAETWGKISAATGAVTGTLTGAYVDRGIIKEGPYRTTTPRTFTISP